MPLWLLNLFLGLLDFWEQTITVSRLEKSDFLLSCSAQPRLYYFSNKKLLLRAILNKKSFKIQNKSLFHLAEYGVIKIEFLLFTQTSLSRYYAIWMNEYPGVVVVGLYQTLHEKYGSIK